MHVFFYIFRSANEELVLLFIYEGLSKRFVPHFYISKELKKTTEI
jgi:hypothetical protein